ncbi:MAG: tRNA-dihydrouridine synthase family protein [Acidobacteria bacterium]|nr:tRNA-dihydrouridine synthase family protein [Acidobacteriota bacterium]MCB9399576.1 tRNA-dihydrouridine synthase family protein [Acidobacteriota bacterium]
MSWPLSSQPLLILAPMDGYTDRAFRTLVKWIEPRTVAFTEFLSAATVAAQPKLAAEWFATTDAEQPVVVQLYGKDPQDFLRAALLAEQYGCAGVDLNMGCPAKKVVAHQHGSALLKNIDLACAIVATLKKHLRVPVTVKTRLGWEDASHLIPFVQRLQDQGLDAITIHGRTYAQKFQGEADWRPIYALKDALNIPVFGNGDVMDGGSALQKLGNLNGVMVGRAATQDPWIMREIGAALWQETSPLPPTLDETAEGWLRFARAAIGDRPEGPACQRMRKFLIQWVRRFGLDHLRAQATAVNSMADLQALFADARHSVVVV